MVAEQSFPFKIKINYSYNAVVKIDIHSLEHNANNIEEHQSQVSIISVVGGKKPPKSAVCDFSNYKFFRNKKHK